MQGLDDRELIGSSKIGERRGEVLSTRTNVVTSQGCNRFAIVCDKTKSRERRSKHDPERSVHDIVSQLSTAELSARGSSGLDTKIGSRTRLVEIDSHHVWDDNGFDDVNRGLASASRYGHKALNVFRQLLRVIFWSGFVVDFVAVACHCGKDLVDDWARKSVALLEHLRVVAA